MSRRPRAALQGSRSPFARAWRPCLALVLAGLGLGVSTSGCAAAGEAAARPRAASPCPASARGRGPRSSSRTAPAGRASRPSRRPAHRPGPHLPDGAAPLRPRARRHRARAVLPDELARLDGFGVMAPITVTFDDTIDLAGVTDTSVLVVNAEPGSADSESESRSTSAAGATPPTSGRRALSTGATPSPPRATSSTRREPGRALRVRLAHARPAPAPAARGGRPPRRRAHRRGARRERERDRAARGLRAPAPGRRRPRARPRGDRARPRLGPLPVGVHDRPSHGRAPRRGEGLDGQGPSRASPGSSPGRSGSTTCRRRSPTGARTPST